MTKVTILGQSHEDVKPTRKIELTHCLQAGGEWSDDWKWHVESGNTYKKAHNLFIEGKFYDVIISEDTLGYINIYLGHFNDGEV